MAQLLFQRSFECPSCGSPVPHRSPTTQTLVCDYCGQTSHLNADSLEAAGEKHLLVDYGSQLAIGQQRRSPSQGSPFMILGRLRLAYEDGFWDEWYAIDLDQGNPIWIQEDDGQLVWFQKEKELSNPLYFEDAQIGEWSDLGGNWEQVFLTSKSRAQVEGGEGELPFRIVPGESADFVEGLWQGQIVSVELLPDEKSLFLGQPTRWEQIPLS
ncbi:MAG: hypothetical protein AAF804_20500 [Bacteroidota bacterium]